MRNTIMTATKQILLGILLLIGLDVALVKLDAQQMVPTFTVTSLTGAVDSTTQTIPLASGTNVTANTSIINIDDEYMLITFTPPATSGAMSVRVQRGYNGTRATNHGNGRTVFVASPVNFGACGGTSQRAQGCGVAYNNLATTRFSSGPFLPTVIPSTLTTAGALTYTPGQVLGLLILRDPNGSARTDTLPTAALMVAAIPGATLDSSFVFWIRNDADASETITIAAGTGGTTSGTMTIAQSNLKGFLLRFTNVNPGSEAYTVYSLGTVTF